MHSRTRQQTKRWMGYGDETPIGKSIRNNPAIPSRGTQVAFVVSNTDLTIHAYMQSVDGKGSREVQSLIRIEFKSHGKRPEPSQIDTLFKEHCGIVRKDGGAHRYRVKGAAIINHGIYICVCSGETPPESESIQWGRFNLDGSVAWKDITLRQYDQLLRFDIHPKTLEQQWLRRRHKERTVRIVVRTPLGFVAEQELTTRS